jgi:hypothetical protein
MAWSPTLTMIIVALFSGKHRSSSGLAYVCGKIKSSHLD